jgi:DNA-binding NtrC family response regulator
LLDIWMPDTDGVSLLKEWSGSGQLSMPVVMMSGHATIETAVEATKLGALSFLEKPITLQKLMQAVESGLKKSAPKATIFPPKPPIVVSVKDVAGNASPLLVAEQMHAMQPDPRNPDLVLRLDQPLREAKEAFDKAYFSYHLQVEHGSVAKVAEKTGIERTHLYRKLKQLGIDAVRNKHQGD